MSLINQPFGNQPNLITDRIKDSVIGILQKFFSQNKEFTWHENENESKIVIADKYSYNNEVLRNKPLISIQRGALRWRYGSLDQRQFTNYSDKDTYLDIGMCDVICLCTSKQGLEAERIAGYVDGFFRSFRPNLRKSGVFEPKSSIIGEERAIRTDSDIDISVVPVSISIEVSEQWTVKEEAPVLEGFEINQEETPAS